MPTNKFGVNLSLEEQQFIDEYIKLMKEYGDSSNFPISDAEKFEKYDKLKKILEKLTSEELAQFNRISDSSMMQEFEEKTEKFGVNLSLEEQQFINEYIKLMEEYGESSNFPISDAEKFEKYDKLKVILEKLTPEELARFNRISDSSMMQEFDSKNDVSMKDVVINAINEGIATEQIEQMDRNTNNLSNEKNTEEVTKDE